MTGATAASVSTHILDTSLGRPAAGVAVTLSVRADPAGAWTAHGTSGTDADGRCTDLPALPAHTTEARLHFAVRPYLARTADGRPAASGAAFFPEVTVVFAVTPGEHYHVPLLLNPFGYAVYRGS
jgi:5-hydroxyisourate hydrolase